MFKFQSLLLISLLLINFACKKKGCTDPIATNYSAEAEKDDQSCNYAITDQKLSYGPDPIQTLQLYLPAHYDANTKVILMVHGGGWVVGYNETSKVTTFSGRYGWNILNPLLNEGYACAVMKYRTVCYQENAEMATGNTTFYMDQMIADIDLAIDLLKSRANSLGIGDDHYQLLGESAGGHIVLAYGLLNASDPDLKSVASMFGPTALDDEEWKVGLEELDFAYPEGLLVDGINYFRTFENSCNLETNKYLSVLSELRSLVDMDTIKISEANPPLDVISPASLSYINRQMPIFLMHGDEDALVPYSQANLMYDAYLTKYPSASIAGDGVYSGDLKKGIYSGCGHGWIGGGCSKSQIMQDIVKWMNAH